MTNFLRRYGIYICAVALLVVSSRLTSYSIREPALPRMGNRLFLSLLYPFESLQHSVFDGISYYWRHYVWLREVEVSNRELRERISALEASTSQLDELQKENDRLRRLLGFQERTGFAGVAAEVIGRDPSNWIKAVTINKGVHEGIRVGQAVVDGHVAVGQITAVTSASARVLLINDNSSSIDVIVQRSRAPGMLEGTMERLLLLNYVEREHDVAIGDRVVTSGLDNIFPKGIMVGVVQDVALDAGSLFQQVHVQPSVDLDILENVYVVTSTEVLANLPEVP